MKKLLFKIKSINIVKYHKYFFDITLIFSILFSSFLLVEAMIITLSMSEVNTNLINKDKIFKFLYTFTVPFVMLSLFFQLYGITEDKKFKVDIAKFSGSWFAIFALSIIIAFSNEVGNIYYNREEHYDIVRLLFYIFHRLSLIYIASYIYYIILFSCFPLIRIIFAANGHYKSDHDISAMIVKYKRAIFVGLVIIFLICLYLFFSLEKTPTIFFKYS